MAKKMNSIEAFIGGIVETPEMGYGHTEAGMGYPYVVVEWY